MQSLQIHTPQALKIVKGAFTKQSVKDDGSAEKFLQNNSIADFMRFKKGSDGGGNGKLQTAIVSYRKKFPWSLLQPFFQDLCRLIWFLQYTSWIKRPLFRKTVVDSNAAVQEKALNAVQEKALNASIS